MTKSPLLSTRNLSVGYEKKEVVKDINLDIFKGEFVSLLGPNGAGKTTLLRTLSRHLPGIKGKVVLKGENIKKIKAHNLAKIMSVVLTQRVVPPLFKVYEFVAMGRYPYTKWTGSLTREDDRVIIQCLGLVHAEDLMFRDISTLSDGERQKILIARALAQDPDIILLDEPTMHLDLKHRMEVMSILHGLCREKGISVIASLHDLEVAAKVSDRVVLIKNDRILAFGTPEDILQKDTVSDLYDFSNAIFNRRLGNIEIRTTPGRSRVFVIGGMGSASVLFRLLCKKGYKIFTGILFKNDIDYFVAKALEIQCFARDITSKNNDEQFTLACRAMEESDFIIDAGFKENDLNLANIEMLEKAVLLKKKVFSLGLDRKRKVFNGHDISRVKFLQTESQLVSAMENRGNV